MQIQNEILKFNGHELLFRCATAEDAQLLIDHLKISCAETRYLVKEPEEITFSVEDEINFINAQNTSNQDLMILAFLDGQYIGNCSLMSNGPIRYRHRISLGIALYQKYTGMGIGRVMVEKLISVAKEKGFEQIELEVVADNDRAISLYKKLGFEIYGTFPNNMKYKDGTYADAYWMMKKLN